jgi:hypothetical protein
MALDKANGSKWKPYNKVKGTSSSEKIRCYGTLHAEFSTVCGKEIGHYYPTNKAHICYNATALFGLIPETRVPLLLGFPSPSWNISKAVIDNIKESLSSLSGRHWINQSHCKTARQYLKELSTSKSLKKFKDQAMAVIQPYVTHVVSHHYKALTNFKVGAICLHGVDSQYDLMGALHCNYHDNVNKKCPMSILNPLSWLLIRSSYCMNHVSLYETGTCISRFAPHPSSVRCTASHFDCPNSPA